MNIYFQLIGDNECWKFTWAGVYDEEEDEDKTCSDYMPGDLCFPPLVFTNETTGSGIPDLA